MAFERKIEIKFDASAVQVGAKQMDASIAGIISSVQNMNSSLAASGGQISSTASAMASGGNSIQSSMKKATQATREAAAAQKDLFNGLSGKFSTTGFDTSFVSSMQATARKAAEAAQKEIQAGLSGKFSTTGFDAAFVASMQASARKAALAANRELSAVLGGKGITTGFDTSFVSSMQAAAKKAATAIQSELNAAMSGKFTSGKWSDSLISSFSKTQQAATQLTPAINSASGAMRSFSTQAVQGIDSVHNGMTRLKAAFAAFGVVLTGREIIDTIDSYTLMNARLAVVTKSQTEFNIAQKDVVRIAQESRVSLGSTVQLYTRIARSLESSGQSFQDVGVITETVNKALIVSGATAGEAAAGTLQLSQAFNKGKLDGDEFRTVMELMPPVAQAIAKEMNVTRGALLALAPQGKITGDIMRKALVAASDEINASFAKMPVTIGQALTQLGNQFILVGGQAAAGFGAGSGIVAAIGLLKDNLGTLLDVATLTATFFTGKFVASLIVSQVAMVASTGITSTLSMGIKTLGLATTITSLAVDGLRVSFAKLNTAGGWATIIAVAATAGMYLYSSSIKETTEKQEQLNKVLETFEPTVRAGINATEDQIKSERTRAQGLLTQTQAVLAAALAERELASAKLDSALADANEGNTREILKASAAVGEQREKVAALEKQIDDINGVIKSFTDQLGSKHVAAIDAVSKKYETLIRSLNEQAMAVGRSKVAQDVLNNVNRAGLDVTKMQVDEAGYIVAGYNAQSGAIASLTRLIHEKNQAFKEAETLKALDQEGMAIDYNKTQLAVANALKQAGIELDNVVITQQGTLIGLYTGQAEAIAQKAIANSNAAAASTKDIDIASDELRLRMQNYTLTEREIQLLLQKQQLLRDNPEMSESELANKQQSLDTNLRLTDQYQKQKDLASSIDGSFDSALTAAIKGTKSLGAAMKDLVVDIGAAIAKAFILAQIQSSIGGSSFGGLIAGGIGKAIGGFANGGAPPVGRPSIVGENGPELFVPKSKGTVIPNSALGGGSSNVSVNTPITVQVVNNGTPQQVQSTSESSTPDGRRMITMIVNDVVKSGISTGAYDSSMGNAFGIRRVGN